MWSSMDYRRVHQALAPDLINCLYKFRVRKARLVGKSYYRFALPMSYTNEYGGHGPVHWISR